MTDQEQKERARHWKEMRNSVGGKMLDTMIKEKIQEYWNKFVDLPPEKKTSKSAFDATGRVRGLEDLIDSIDSEIKLGE